MKLDKSVLAIPLILAGMASLPAVGAVKTYQVTGPVESVTDSTIVMMKGKEKWELARDASTKVKGDLKPGAKITVEYRMTATNVDVKAGKSAARSSEKKRTR